MVVAMNLESREKLAKLIQELRGTQTLSGFAKQFNVSYQAVSKWKIVNPSLIESIWQK